MIASPPPSPTSWSPPPKPRIRSGPLFPMIVSLLTPALPHSTCPAGLSPTSCLWGFVTVLSQERKLVSPLSVAQGKKSTSAETDWPVPIDQTDGPLGSPHQLFLPLMTVSLSFWIP